MIRTRAFSCVWEQPTGHHVWVGSGLYGGAAGRGVEGVCSAVVGGAEAVWRRYGHRYDVEMSDLDIE